MRRPIGAALALTLLCGRIPALAQPVPARVTLSGDVELSRLVELVAREASVSIEYAPTDLAKRITLRVREALTARQLWDVLAATLEGQGLVIVRTERAGVYRVVPVAQAAAQNQDVLLPPDLDAARAVVAGDGGVAGENDAAPDGGPRPSYLTLVLPLRTLDPQEAAAAIGPLLTPQSGVAKPLGGSLLLLADARRRVEQALSVLSTLDGAAGPASTFIVTLQQTTAAEITPLLERTLSARAAQGAMRPKSLSGAAAPGGGGGGGGAAPGGAGASGVQFIAMPDERRLLVVCAGAREREVRELIATLDSKEPLETRAYTTLTATAEDLAATMRNLLDASRTGVVGGSGGSGGGGVRIVADRLTGSVMVTAPGRDHARLRDLVERLNSAPGSARQTLRSFVIKNRGAKELAGTLDNLLAAGALGAGAASAAPPGGQIGSTPGITPAPGPVRGNASGLAQTGAPPQSPPPSGLAGGADAGRAPGDVAGAIGGFSSGARGRRIDLTLSVDEPTNAILAIGEPALLRQLETLIAELDKRQAQVMIEASLVSLSDSEALSFGVELSGQFTAGATQVNLASLFGLSSGAGAGGPLASGAGFTGTVLNPGDYQVVVRALETVNTGRAVSTPKVLVNNNATGTLRGVQRQPFTSINASQTVATTSFGGTQDAGTTITVTPKIAAGDHLLLDYKVELSAFTGSPTTTAGGGIIPPPSQQNTVEGSATIPDGFTVVVGGLDNSSETSGQSRLPVLGRIPILGWLFGTTNDSDSRTRFFVFIKATVLRSDAFDDLKRISTADAESAHVSTGSPPLLPRWVE